jgi:predicted RNA-binding protein with PUA-like domain
VTTKRNHWLFKSEPDAFGYDDLEARPGKTEPWDGVRNYQARNFMRDDAKVGDLVLFYHSRCDPPHVAGIAEVASEPYPDPTQFDPDSKYFDPKSTPEEPRWFLVDVRAVRKLERPVSLAELKANPALSEMVVTQKGSRLSIQPVREDEYREVLAMAARTPIA